MTRTLRLRSAALLVFFLALGCGDDPRECEALPAGTYKIRFLARTLYVCDSDRFPRNILLESKDFSKRGCELNIGGLACGGYPGFCGELRWKAPGVYEGGLDYATMRLDQLGGISDCLIHSEDVELTRIDAGLDDADMQQGRPW